jgi:hypothetical protein
MEYLMTYGWAILVVMIVGIVMWQLGIFNLGQNAITTTGFGKIKPQIAGSGCNQLGHCNFVFTNGAGTRISITSYHIDDLVAVGSSCNFAAGNIVNAANVANTIPAAGENFRITAPATCIRGTAAGGNTGDVFNARVRITYSITVGGIQTTHTDTGTIRGPFET